MKRLRTILFFLFLGAVVNVVVAWGFAFANLRGDLSGRGLSYWWQGESRYTWIVENRQDRGTYRCQSYWLHGYLPARPDDRTAQELLPPWASYALPHEISHYHAQRMTTGHGWPWLAMWSGMETDEVGQLVEVSAGYLPQFIATNPRALFPIQRVFPLGFIWAGFVLNTVVYFAVLWLSALTICKARHSIRSFRGLCPKCAYDLKGAEHDVCPECGANAGGAINAR